jgi:hypothetical protein
MQQIAPMAATPPPPPAAMSEMIFFICRKTSDAKFEEIGSLTKKRK